MSKGRKNFDSHAHPSAQIKLACSRCSFAHIQLAYLFPKNACICYQTACKNIFLPQPSSTSTSVVSCLSCILAGKVGSCVLHCSDDRSNYRSLHATFPQNDVCIILEQRFPTFLTRGALFRINFYGGAPCLPYILQVNGV